jgi:hypothetical protein
LRRAHGVERQQLKLVLAVGTAAASAGGLLMSTWLVWPHGHLPLRIAVLGVLFAAFPVAAGIAILRYRLFDIDVVINRTLVYGAVTLVLAAVFAATTLLLGTALGRGSPWATAAATLVAAIAFRPLRTRVQDAVDKRFNRARYDALHQMTGFLEALRAGRAAPEEVERFLRELLGDPRLEILFFLPESELYVDARGLPAAELPDDGRERIPIERDGQPLGIVLHDPATRSNPTCCAALSRPADSRSKSRGCGSNCAASSPRSKRHGRGSSRPQTRSAGGSNATSTTAPSSGSFRSASHSATRNTS